VAQAAKDMEKVLEAPMSPIAEKNPRPPSAPPYPLFSKQFFRRHGHDFFACSSTWFLVDIIFYSSNFFQPLMYKHFSDREKNDYEEVFEVAKVQAIITACSTIPGYWFTVYFIDRIGRVRIQTMGFLSMTAVSLAIEIPYNEYWKNQRVTSFRALNGLIFFLSNFGPNTTTFMVPAELFPERFRSTCHGISGAAGKVGAIVGSVGFLWASHGDPKIFGMTAALVILS
jgi:PHS family inorganic phosphate transporter-like MFS transporter